MTPNTAREHVRVARALQDLPLIRHEFEQGRLSYSKVRAVTRVANEHNEPDFIHMALNSSGAQLERICAGYRKSNRAQPATAAEAAAAAFANRRFTTRRNEDDTISFSLTVTVADGTDIEKAVERHVTAIINDIVANSPDQLTRRQAIADRHGIKALRADAATALLTGQTKGEPIPTDLTIVVNTDNHPARINCNCGRSAPEPDPSTPSPDSRTSAETVRPNRSSTPLGERFRATVEGHHVAQSTAERLCCDPRIAVLIEDATQTPLGVGRITRLINRRLRRALKRRDNNTCQFPGCASTDRLHAYHIKHWTNHGPTDPENLILVCHFHHHSVHEGGWTIDPITRQFHKPDQTPVDHRPATLNHVADPHMIEPTTWRGDDLEPPMYGPFDLPWTTTILQHNETIRRQQHKAAMN